MKKLILILLCFPLLSFGQDLIVFTKHDLVINQILHNTAQYFNDKNTPKVEFRFFLKNQKSNIDWNKEKFSKWKIKSTERRNPKDKSLIIK
jgi:hypothetical protein